MASGTQTELEDPALECRLHKGQFRQYAHSPPQQLVGAWETVIPRQDGAAIGNILGMQTMHSVMLPSGKILLVSGSSWRNFWSEKDPIQYYPKYANPEPPSGCFAYDDPFNKSKLAAYYEVVNNAAIYDPANNTFYRIPHPVPVDDPQSKDHFAPNDLFCTGHQHLPDGNVLFTGGTQYYSPFRTGNRSTYIFDWRKEVEISWPKVDWRQLPQPKNDPWTFAGFMERGRWYPTLVPLLDGRLALFSGFVDLDLKKWQEKKSDKERMYMFEINSFVEFFDPSRFNPAQPQAAWRSVDVSKTQNSPFTVEINPDFKPTPGVNKRGQSEACGDRCQQENKFDAFKLYPVNYLMPDGRIFFTGEGDWVSLRTCDTAFMRRTKHTYWGTIGGTPDAPTMSFAAGPERAHDVTSYGTSFLDPNNGEMHILGGQPTSAGTLLPINSVKHNHFAGGRGSRQLESFQISSAAPDGKWMPIDKDFLGDEPQDDRTMHYAIILPTRQVLMINGGNYDFYGPVHYPLLLTPRFRKGRGAGEPEKVLLGYERTRMADAVEPRLYHNVAMLLPDGRIFVSGGNTSRATVHLSTSQAPQPADSQPKPDLSLVETDVYFFDDGPMAKGQQGMMVVPTENWTAEIFSPPYMFSGNDAPQVRIARMAPAQKVDYTFSKQIGGKPYFLLRGNRGYDLELDKQPPRCARQWVCKNNQACGDGQACTDGSMCMEGKASLSLIKLPSATHGWENGQKFVELPFTERDGDPQRLRFQTPELKSANAPPGYYMLFYVDCQGKPSIAQMVRFDDTAKEP
ncbi:galactose oxidase early set domain-containing protein [Hyalangium rubrum]|uniref:Galactose oxidase early set domain-containing protein n=1 Tax=Hyalangium rubrum TaxID=3103134 RepID=A0ABU5GX01_9BACT|nr:galactose oxidase early set domain-containing protein [Hyalangium sp. s54d21]MDY7225720.1 galactose oxidase early set domain-containing protein [Hyalangium sp. s54d21]